MKNNASSIGDVLKNIKIEKKKTCAYEWQQNAFEMAEKLGIDFKKDKSELGRWLNLFRIAHIKGRVGKLHACYSFLIDYSKPLNRTEKMKLFFWRYGQK